MSNVFEENAGWVWMDGEFVQSQHAKVHLLTHTLHYGSGVFEGVRAYNGRIFKMTEHHQRLHDSARMLEFEIPYTVDRLNSVAQEILTRNSLKNAYLRPLAWHGSEGLSVASHKNSIHVAIAAWEWGSYFSSESMGLKLTWADWIRPAPTMAPVHAKANGQYIIGTLSKNKAERSGYHDALMLDYRGYIAECTGANVFMVKDGIVYTPIADCFLNGITRQTVIELIKKHGLTLIEKHILPADIMKADEIFITGTAVEIQPVIQLAEQHFSIGMITKQMISAYHQLVNEVEHE